MYSGTIITHGSGRLMGTHQKIDRVARKKLHRYLGEGQWFPRTREILRFEGLNGPDGIKRKSPAHDEPRHFINPDDPNDRHLIELIRGNQNNLIEALMSGNRERASFEAAWLAHAIVDGLTPAHHYPYEERLAEIRGNTKQLQDTIFRKVIMPGDTMRDKVANNWKYWKPTGLMTAHGLYEVGVAFATAPLRFKRVALSKHDIELLRAADDFEPFFMDAVQRVHQHKIYDRFLQRGWTESLARETKNFLLPEMIHAVLMAWYFCAYQAKVKRHGDS